MHAKIAERFQKLLKALFFAQRQRWMKEAPSNEGASLVSGSAGLSERCTDSLNG